MDSKIQALPPLKRFRLMQQQEEQQIKLQDSNESNSTLPFCLPAKKRMQSFYPHPILSKSATAAAAATTTYSLPAKKRVWAVQPDFVSDQSSINFDLNVEWKPTFTEETEKAESNPLLKSTNNDKDDEAAEEEEDDGIVCAVCQSTDGDQKDPIVFCDSCDLMVHTTCYGDPLVKGIPEGDWFCAQCLAARSSNTDDKPNNLSSSSSCCLCPNKDGAMKLTKDGSWAHVVCAVFVPEVFFEDPEGREGIDCSKVPKARREKKCYVCKSKRGCAVECSEPKCPLWFHVTCGLKEDLCIEYREGKKGVAVVAGFCKDHTELWKKQQQTGKFKIVAREQHKIYQNCV